MGFFTDAGKIISESPPIRQLAVEPGPYVFDLNDEDGDPVLERDIVVGGWIEQIGNEAPSTYEVSQRSAHATLYAYIPNRPDIIYNFENAVLGWHVTYGGGNIDGVQVPMGGFIKRTNPIQHPRKRNLWAYRISEAKGIVYQSREAISISEQPPIGPVAPVRYAQYNRTLVAVDFKPNPTSFLMSSEKEIKVRIGETDEFYYHEGYRYLEYETKTNITDISVQTGQFVFVEGAPNGKPFIGELNFIEVRQTFILRWRLVPEDFVCDMTNFHLAYPRKLNAASGKVNSKPFMGYPAGTLLLIETELDRYASGALRAKPADVIPGQSAEVDRPFQMVDVMLTLVHFDPPHFSAENRGHNIKPFRADTTTTPTDVLPWQFWRPEWTAPWNNPPPVPPQAPEPSMLYYLVKYRTSGGVTTETRIYGQYDFNKIFQHWAAK